jgi:hypothetical protein
MDWRQKHLWRQDRHRLDSDVPNCGGGVSDVWGKGEGEGVFALGDIIDDLAACLAPRLHVAIRGCYALQGCDLIVVFLAGTVLKLELKNAGDCLGGVTGVLKGDVQDEKLSIFGLIEFVASARFNTVHRDDPGANLDVIAHFEVLGLGSARYGARHNGGRSSIGLTTGKEEEEYEARKGESKHQTLASEQHEKYPALSFQQHGQPSESMLLASLLACCLQQATTNARRARWALGGDTIGVSASSLPRLSIQYSGDQ